MTNNYNKNWNNNTILTLVKKTLNNIIFYFFIKSYSSSFKLVNFFNAKYRP